MANRSETMSSTRTTRSQREKKANDRKGGSNENDVIETMAKNCSNKEIGRNKFENNFICHKRNNNFWNVFFSHRFVDGLSSLCAIFMTY